MRRTFSLARSQRLSPPHCWPELWQHPQQLSPPQQRSAHWQLPQQLAPHMRGAALDAEHKTLLKDMAIHLCWAVVGQDNYIGENINKLVSGATCLQ